MELADLIDRHTVVYMCDARVPDTIDQTIMSTADIGDLMSVNHSFYFSTLFRFDSEIRLATNSYFLDIKYTFDSNITWGAYSGTDMRIVVYVSALQDQSDKVRLTLYGKIGAGDFYSSVVYLDVGTTYQVQMRFDPNSSYDGYMSIQINDLNANGHPVATRASASTGATVYCSGFPTSHTIRIGLTANFTGSFRVYETSLQNSDGSYNDGCHALWHARRQMYWTYYDEEHCTSYLMPPQNIADGAGYDRSAALLEIIEDNQAEIAGLEGDLVIAQADLTSLQEKITTGFITAITNNFATITSWITGIDVEILKMAAAFGAGGKFTLATLDDALSQIINAAFDALEEVL